jgi:3-phosphoshikimate 1-carboxyvinyltransferase
MLSALGAQLTITSTGTHETIITQGPFRPAAREHLVPGDPSSAAFFTVLAGLTSGQILIRGVLDNPTRTGFLDILGQMGLRFERLPTRPDQRYLEPVVDLLVHGGHELTAVETDAAKAPTFIDEVPILAVAALCARGVSRFRGLGELRVKESDRLAKVVELLSLVGKSSDSQKIVWTEGDDLLIAGGHRRIAGFSFDPDEDHRLAMAAAILGKIASEPVTIADPQCVAVSFPHFFSVLSDIG